MNSSGSTNGNLTMSINGTTLINKSVRWADTSTGRQINLLSFDIYRGGDQSWAASKTCYISIDNLSWK